jgi:cytoskeletal protein CcmA (bactofilin family)
VDGEIIATNADIAGRVQGEIEVEERLVLKSTAQVDGNIETDRLVVEEGAQFTGECKMGTPISINGESAGDDTGSALGSDEEDVSDEAEETTTPSTAAE